MILLLGVTDPGLQEWWPDLGTVVADLRRIHQNGLAELLLDAIRGGATSSEILGEVGVVLRNHSPLRAALSEPATPPWRTSIALSQVPVWQNGSTGSQSAEWEAAPPRAQWTGTEARPYTHLLSNSSDRYRTAMVTVFDATPPEVITRFTASPAGASSGMRTLI